jgi:hypothetical protein
MFLHIPYKRNISQKGHDSFGKFTEKHAAFIAAMFFIGIFLMVFFGNKTLVTWKFISYIYLLIAVFITILPLKRLPFIYFIRKELKILLTIFGLAPFLTGVLLMLNFIFTDNPVIKTVNVTAYKYYPYDETVEVILDDDFFNQFSEIRKFTAKRLTNTPQAVVYTIKSGLLGMKVIDKSELIFKKK